MGPNRRTCARDQIWISTSTTVSLSCVLTHCSFFLNCWSLRATTRFLKSALWPGASPRATFRKCSLFSGFFCGWLLAIFFSFLCNSERTCYKTNRIGGPSDTPWKISSLTCFVVVGARLFLVTSRLLQRRPSTSSRLSRPLPRTLSSRRLRSRCKKTASICFFLGLFIFRLFISWSTLLMLWNLFLFAIVISLIPSRSTAILPRTLDALARQLEGEQTKTRPIFYLWSGVGGGSIVKSRFFFVQRRMPLRFTLQPFFHITLQQEILQKNERTYYHLKTFTLQRSVIHRINSIGCGGGHFLRLTSYPVGVLDISPTG